MALDHPASHGTGPLRNTPAGMDKARIETLADGIFAIAMTLMVFNLRVPPLADAVAESELPRALVRLVPSFLTLGLSFVILGIYWVAHHNQYHYIRRVDRPLLWINILLLAAIAFVPFSTSVLGAYPRHRMAVLLYGANLVLVGLVFLGHWSYATRGHRLVDPDLPAIAIRRLQLRLVAGPIAYSLGIVVAFWKPEVSLALYVLVHALLIAPGWIDRYLLPRR